MLSGYTYFLIKGSTTQWEMHPDVMQAGLQLHNRLMRQKIKECHGYEVKTEGDAFMVAFAEPLEVSCSLLPICYTSMMLSKSFII